MKIKQTNLTKEIYNSILSKDTSRQEELHKLQMKKIFKRKRKEKSFNAKWTVSDF